MKKLTSILAAGLLASCGPNVEVVEAEKARYTPEIVAQLILEYDYQVKFVVDKEEDLDEIRSYLAELDDVEPSKVYLMPQGIEIDELIRTGNWLENYCHQHGFQFCPRKQIEWFGTLRGT